jgi:hypothetical protein
MFSATVGAALLVAFQASAQDASFKAIDVPRAFEVAKPATIDNEAATNAAQPEATPEPPNEQPSQTKKKGLSQAAVAAAIIAASIAYYKSDSGGPCACPEDVDRGGRRCGKRSAYSRSGGYAVTCYARDVKPDMVSSWRTENEK